MKFIGCNIKQTEFYLSNINRLEEVAESNKITESKFSSLGAQNGNGAINQPPRSTYLHILITILINYYTKPIHISHTTHTVRPFLGRGLVEDWDFETREAQPSFRSPISFPTGHQIYLY